MADHVDRDLDVRALINSTLTEAQYQAQIVKAAKAHGWMVYHTYDSRRSTAGFPDLVLVRPPRLLFAEIKLEKEPVTPSQYEWLTGLKECGEVYAIVVRPSGWDMIVEMLR